MANASLESWCGVAGRIVVPPLSSVCKLGWPNLNMNVRFCQLGVRLLTDLCCDRQPQVPQ